MRRLLDIIQQLKQQDSSSRKSSISEATRSLVKATEKRDTDSESIRETKEQKRAKHRLYTHERHRLRAEQAATVCVDIIKKDIAAKQTEKRIWSTTDGLVDVTSQGVQEMFMDFYGELNSIEYYHVVVAYEEIWHLQSAIFRELSTT